MSEQCKHEIGPHYITLVLDTGDIVDLEVPDEHLDDVNASLNSALKRKDSWSPCAFEGCKAEFMGHYLTKINMARVVGEI